MADITPEELRPISPCWECHNGVVSVSDRPDHPCTWCGGTGVCRNLNHSALAELIRARCEAAFASGVDRGIGYQKAIVSAPSASIVPRPVNPFAKGGA